MNTDKHRYKKEGFFSSSSVFIRVHLWSRIFFLVGVTVLLIPDAHALKSDADQPINVRARSVEVNEKTGISVYRGSVVMTQGSLTIEADRVEVVLRNGQTERVRANGKPLRMRMRTDAGENVRASAARADYDNKAQRMDLYDNVELHRDNDIFTGATLRYLLNDDTFTADGGEGQVSATLQPAKRDTNR